MKLDIEIPDDLITKVVLKALREQDFRDAVKEAIVEKIKWGTGPTLVDRLVFPVYSVPPEVQGVSCSVPHKEEWRAYKDLLEGTKAHYAISPDVSPYFYQRKPIIIYFGEPINPRPLLVNLGGPQGTPSYQLDVDDGERVLFLDNDLFSKSFEMDQHVLSNLRVITQFCAAQEAPLYLRIPFARRGPLGTKESPLLIPPEPQE